MENRNQLFDASIEKVMTDIEQTRREDIVVDANRVRLIPAPNGTRIEAAFEGCGISTSTMQTACLDGRWTKKWCG